MTAARQLGVLRDQRIQPVRLKHYQMKLLAPSIHQDTSFTAMCALDGHSMQLGLQQQPAGRVSSCTLPGPDSCQLQLRSLSGGMTVPCSTQLQTPALLPPGWLPCLPSQLPAAAAPCPLLLGASVLSLPGAVSHACNNGTPCLPATCALPERPAVMTSTAADVTTAAAATRRQSSGGHETAAAGADSAEDSEEPDTPGSSDSWDSDYEAPPEPKRRGRPCTTRPTIAIKHVQQQVGSPAVGRVREAGQGGRRRGAIMCPQGDPIPSLLYVTQQPPWLHSRYSCQ